MVKLRLRRQGRKGKPFYYIVAADARAPRDGRFIERIGSYNPNTNPATIDLNLDDAVRWLGNGAIPTDTCRAILSYKGAMHKHHLNKGVAKGALTQEQADKKFSAWMEEKESRIQSKRDGLSQAEADKAAAAHQKEIEIRTAREKAIAEKNAPEGVAEDAAEAAASEEAVAEAPAEEAVAETPAEEVAEAPAEEAVAETPAEEVAEAPAEEVVAEATPAEETPAEDAPAEETPEAEA
ncbi:MAG: 30S ribosomal protein S16 [Bacteroidia bacterium]|nr:30S ribosomal protein S16 [Bacteroidia bacterium]NNJ56359.1 30S ribosomal protein S16 [Bacteroidia bacterium]